MEETSELITKGPIMQRMRAFFVTGGVISSLMLIGFGTGSIAMGVHGRSDVRDSIAREKIVGTPDMAKVAGKKIDTGSRARDFANGMRKHTLEATGGRTYAEMGRYLTKRGTETNDMAKAATDPKTGAPVENGARNIWVTSTALTTALNTSYFAEQVSMFSIVMGVALLLTGIGFAVLTFGALRIPEGTVTVMPVRERGTATTA
jgi:hypothetical protein